MIVGAVGGVVALAALGLYRTFGAALGRLSIGELSIDGTKITMDPSGPRPTSTSFKSTAISSPPIAIPCI
jgi:hypothetical protein